MEQPAEATQSAKEFTNTGQMAYAAPTYRPVAAVAGATTKGMIPPPISVQPPHPFVSPQVPQFYQPQQQLFQEFGSNQMQEIEQTDYKNHRLPLALARIKKIMKAVKDVRMISSNAPVVMAKACEIFILELTMRSWIQTEENKRRTLQKNDLAGAISKTHKFDFLADIVPRDEMKEEEAGILRSVGPGNQMSYYYMPAHADPAAGTVTTGGHGVQDPRLMAYMLQQAQVHMTSEAAVTAAASTMAGIQYPRPMMYMLQQTQVQETSEAEASAYA